ncbi:MAG TPA: DUF2169 domain-containing protein [Vicinamibacterales bacterium]|nr:DUF2169 domain-containing protein [Vicinamibacterales bacterium]
MWALDNRTPYAAERSWVQDKDGVQHWIVVVKATYDILGDGHLALADEQEPPNRMGKHRGDPATSSLISDADIIGRKVATDVIVNGTAYAPHGRPVQSIEVRLRVANVDKTLLVTGDRRWRVGAGGAGMTAAQPFDAIPLIYERAFGGFDQQDDDAGKHRLYANNPVGTGFAIRPEHLKDRLVPNVEYPTDVVRSWKDRPAPAGFGPIDRWWSPRREYAGTYDAQWLEKRFPLWAVDFDERFHQSAPSDQQVPGFLRGGETVELTNLTPSRSVRFALPRVHLGFATFFGRETRHHVGHLDAVIVEPDINRVMLVWQSILACHHDVDDLDRTRIFQKAELSSPGLDSRDSAVLEDM